MIKVTRVSKSDDLSCLQIVGDRHKESHTTEHTLQQSHRTNKDCVWGAPNVYHPSETISSALSHRATATSTLRANPLSWRDNMPLSFLPHLMGIKELRKSYFFSSFPAIEALGDRTERKKGWEEMRGGSQHGVSQASVIQRIKQLAQAFSYLRLSWLLWTWTRFPTETTLRISSHVAKKRPCCLSCRLLCYVRQTHSFL